MRNGETKIVWVQCACVEDRGWVGEHQLARRRTEGCRGVKGVKEGNWQDRRGMV